MNALLLYLGADDGVAGWSRIVDGATVDRGDGTAFAPPDAPERLVAIAPAEAVMLHSADLTGLAPAQARAAARLMVSENSVPPIDSLHVALDKSGEADRAIAVVSSARMAGWLAALQGLGLDPDAIVPAPLLLPRPDEGYVGGMIGGSAAIRGRNSGFAADDAIGTYVVGDAPLEELDGERLDAAIARAVDEIALDLRQGPFARRRKFALDWALVRRLGWLLLAILTVTMLISLGRIARYEFAADALDLRAKAAARRVLPEASADPVAALTARLASLRGGGLGFPATAGVLFAAVQATPNIELRSLDFDSDGALRATVLAPGKPEADALTARIEALGLAVEPSPFQTEAGRIRGELRVAPR